jgi:hypothetical protein
VARVHGLRAGAIYVVYRIDRRCAPRSACSIHSCRYTATVVSGPDYAALPSTYGSDGDPSVCLRFLRAEDWPHRCRQHATRLDGVQKTVRTWGGNLPLFAPIREGIAPNPYRMPRPAPYDLFMYKQSLSSII